MEESRYCLYLPGICMHVFPVSSDTGKSELHLDLDKSPDGFTFRTFKALPLHLHPALQPPTPFESPTLSIMVSESSSALPSPQLENHHGTAPSKLTSHDKAFENTSTSVAASQMRNALNNLADTVADPEEKKVRFAYKSPSWIPS